MSKVTNDGLTGSGTGWSLYPYFNSGRQRVNGDVLNGFLVDKQRSNI